MSCHWRRRPSRTRNSTGVWRATPRSSSSPTLRRTSRINQLGGEAMATPADVRAALVKELGLDKQNGGALGRLLANGNIGRAEEGPDGRMRATIRINPDELVYDPSVLVLPHGGDLDLELINDDRNTHC